MTQSQRSKLVDPFQGQSILSLNPRTFRDSKLSLKSNDLEAIHQHMSSLALQSLDKHFEEAKSVIDGSLEFLNSKESSEPKMKENEEPRKNRPALARKRAKFSMKPDISQPSAVPEPTFEMDQLRNPEDFFAAFEKHEKAIKELRRQRGEDQYEPKISATARQRRPEIARRKSSYRHYVYSSQPENDTEFSQEALQDTVESQPMNNSQHETVTPNEQSKEKEGAEQITKAEDRINKLFDDLMSSDIADLDENKALSFLKERLNIKPVSIPALQVNVPAIPRVDLVSSGNSIESLDILPGMSFSLDKLKDNTLGNQKKLPGKPVNPLSSSTPRRSPFSAISKFSKLISKSIESADPFSARAMDLSPTATTVEMVSGPSTGASKDKGFVDSASKDNLPEPPINMEDNEKLHNMEEMDEVIQGNGEDMEDRATSPTELYLNIDEDMTDNLHSENETRENIKDTTEKVVPSSPQENNEITIEELESNHVQSAQKDDSSVNVPAETLPIQIPDIVPEQQNEEPPKTISNRKKSRARKVDLRKKRDSLAGAGSSLSGGVRRSKRIKSKPLEYWKGERLLYGRVHNSMPTVIGMKYISPSKDGFKVKSFVGDEYKDLVDLTSLH